MLHCRDHPVSSSSLHRLVDAVVSGVIEIPPWGDAHDRSDQYRRELMFERLRPDRLPNRDAAWFAGDALLALVLGFLTVDSVQTVDYTDSYGPVEGIRWAWLLGPSALVLVRRSAPLTVFAAATVCYLLAASDLGTNNAILAAPFLAYPVALSRPPRVSGVIVGVAGAAATLSVLALGEGVIVLLLVSLHFVAGWIVGTRVRSNRERSERLAEEADAAREEVAETARKAVADERVRIARELHDAVGHAVNVMVMQAGAARLSIPDERTARPLREIERVGRSALADLDRMLGLLHDDADGPAPLEPAYGMADIPRLVDGVRAAGADVHLDDRCGGDIDMAVERPIGAAAYRIVQEALTNAVKHAGPARIDVSLSCDEDELVICVADDGRGAASRLNVNGGRGIAGMAERVNVLGGRLAAGPRPGGGFRIEAQLPRSDEHR